MKGIWFHLMLASLAMGVGVGVRMKALGGPSYVLEGDNATLNCDFDLEGDSLYSLIWWMEGSVLLRYTAPVGGRKGAEGAEDPMAIDPLAWFLPKGVEARLGASGGPEDLWLLKAGPEASATYSCEVTAEAPPTFLTANASLSLRVLPPPSGSPVMLGTEGEVEEGQWIASRCEAPPMAVSPNVTFYINQKPVADEFMSAVEVKESRAASRSVGFSAVGHLFRRGRLALECRVTVGRLAWRASSLLALVGGGAMSAAVSSTWLLTASVSASSWLLSACC